jgi:hypothetical protein
MSNRRSQRVAVAALLLATFALAARGARAENDPPPPPCSTIPVELLDPIDSANAKVGDRFRFRALETVVTSDQAKIERGTLGYGVVELASPAGAHARPGELLLEARYFVLPRERIYQVTVDTAASTEIHSGSTRNAPGMVGVLPVPFVGIAVGAFNYFHAGSNVTVPVGYHFAVTPVGDLAKDRRCRPEFQL